MVTVVPETVQTLVVELAKVTVVPAESSRCPIRRSPPALRVWSPVRVQLMVWFAPLMVILKDYPR